MSETPVQPDDQKTSPSSWTAGESEERFRKVFHEASFGMLIVDRDHLILRANAAICDMLGYSEEELCRRSMKELSHPETLEQDLASIARMVAGEVPVYKTEKRYLRKDGGTLWASVVITAVRNDRDDFLYNLTMIEDITERKRAEEELRKSKEVLELIFKISPDAGVITRLRDGLIVDINDRFEILSEYSRAEVIGKTSVELHLYEIAGSREKIVEELRRTGHCQNIETVFRTKGGRNFTGIMSSQVVFLYGDHHVYSLVHDLTERQKTEALLMNAQKLDALGILAGGIAHDFNNLLTGIFGYIDLARHGSREAQTIEFLDAAVGSLSRAKALTLQLLTFAKGGAPLKRITPLPRFIEETARFALSGANVSCAFRFDETLWPCNIDKNQIGQVIDNIVINAQQAMPNGGTIEVTARNVALEEKHHPLLQAGDYVRVSIKDCGIGIPREFLPRIFDPFYTTKTKGHGLGLATSYSIVNRHGGCIDVESEPGRGSTFHLYLPACRQSPTAPEAGGRTHRGSGRVIVVDDEEVVRESVRRMFEALGYTVVCHSDGQAAVDFYRGETRANRSFAAMILDLTIPGGMGGREAVRQIRTFDPQIPLFVMSGYADDRVMENPGESGFTASICKPFTIAELSEMLETGFKPKENV